MKYVIIGDIGLKQLYHVGDEAMMDAALEMLAESEPDQITLVAGDPGTATAQYGYSAVKRVGFSPHWTRQQSDDRLQRETSPASLDGATDGSLADVVRRSDVVVIAGGGNMTSRYAHHLYERVVLTRMARHFGKRLIVTSQTVGPVLREEDVQLLAEIVDYASIFGARDDESFRLLRALETGSSADTVRRTVDDGVLLVGDPPRAKPTEAPILPERYIVASFTSDQGTTGLSLDEYLAAVTTTLDQLAVELDADVLLVPHTGLPEDGAAGDEISDDRIVAASTSGRLRALSILNARDTALITAGAILTVCTRYHAAVFAVAAGIPTVAVSLSYYSSVRFRGAMSPAGLEPYIVPASAWDQIVPACLDLVSRWGAIGDDVGRITNEQRDFQRQWWAELRGLAHSGARSLSTLPRRPPVIPTAGWAEAVRESFVSFDAESRERNRTEWLEHEAHVLAAALTRSQSALEQSRAKTVELTQRLDGVESRKVVRLANRLGDILNALRRPHGRVRQEPEQ